MKLEIVEELDFFIFQRNSSNKNVPILLLLIIAIPIDVCILPGLRLGMLRSNATVNNEINMYVVGILGGIASGKSLVTGLLARRGALIIDADRIGHQVLKTPEVKALIHDRWGDAVFDSDGEVNRRRLAAIVFDDSPTAQVEREFLEKFTHPAIGQEIRAILNHASIEGVKLAVLDAPVMLEAGWDAVCDTLVYIDSPREIRCRRAMESRGWKKEDFAAREAAQKSLEKKRSRADFVIDNSTCIDSVEQQVDRLWKSWESSR